MPLLVKIIILTFLVTPNLNAQPDYFEGKITYESYNREDSGELVPSKVIGRQEQFFKGSFYKFNMELKTGPTKLSFSEIIVNTEDTSRYRVDHFNKTASSLGMEGPSTAYLPIEIKLLPDRDTILGYPCKKYKMLQLDYYTQKVKKVFLWVAEDIPIRNLPLLGRISGYRNSFIKDGSLNGAVLKHETESTLDIKGLMTQAIEVRPMELEISEFIVPRLYSSNTQ